MHRIKKDWADWLDFRKSTKAKRPTWILRLLQLCKKRQVEIIRITANAWVNQVARWDSYKSISYTIHLTFLMRQENTFYREERLLPYQYEMENDATIAHKKMEKKAASHHSIHKINPVTEKGKKLERVFTYNRLQAVQYAERWWNSDNPSFQKFDVDCANYVSQCIDAGGSPMWGYPNRKEGWWYQGNEWSFSWAVAHSLRWYLSGAIRGIKGIEVHKPEQLMLGDVICYDFKGDGRYDHTTIVVAKDQHGMPLVNAHTENSRHRYWSYEDSTAWTPTIQYKFFHLTET